jgi:hypothetical protein
VATTCPANRFETIDRRGVGDLVRLCTERGIDVSCSPFRVPGDIAGVA